MKYYAFKQLTRWNRKLFDAKMVCPQRRVSVLHIRKSNDIVFIIKTSVI